MGSDGGAVRRCFFYALLAHGLCGFAFGQCLNRSYFPVSSQWSSQALSTTILSNSTHGGWCTFLINAPGPYCTNNPTHPESLPFNLCAGGPQADDGNTCIAIADNGLDNQNVFFYPYGLDDTTLGTKATNQFASIGGWVRSDMVFTPGVGQHDMFVLRGQNDFLTLYMITDESAGNVTMGVESSSWEDNNQDIVYTPNSWIWVTSWADSNATANVNLSVYDIHTNLLKTWTHVRTGSGTWSAMELKFQSNGLGGTSGFHVYYAGMIMDFTAAGAILPQSPAPKTHYSISTSQVDAQRAVDNCPNVPFGTPPDTAILPVGTNTWTGIGGQGLGVAYKSVVITSAGGGYAGSPTGGFGRGNFTNCTVITNNIDTTHAVIGMTLDYTNWAVISNLDFATIPANQNGNVAFGTLNTNCPCFRVTGCKFYVAPTAGGSPYNSIYTFGTYGLIDNCYFRKAGTNTGGHGIGLAFNGNMTSATNYHIPQFDGDKLAVVIETCTFDYDSRDDNCMDVFSGQKFVYRYNTHTNTWPGCHGADTDARGCRKWDLNHNFFYSRNGFTDTKMFTARSGTGVIWSNFTDSGWAGAAVASFREYRASASFNGQQYSGSAGFLPAGGLQGNMNGSRIVDGNFATNGYPGLDQVGRGSFSVNPVVWTATFLTNNYEALEPAYLWGNNVAGNTAPLATTAAFDELAGPIPNIIQAGRDYYDNTVKPGYFSLAYPYPFDPNVTLNPTDQTVTAPAAATFSCGFSGATWPGTIQWYKNGVAIGGATSSSYTTPATSGADDGTQFYAIGADAGGSVQTLTATLHVNAGGSSVYKKTYSGAYGSSRR